jgi:hypothetical protein
MVPLIVEAERSIVKYTYCHECIYLEYPGLNFGQKASLLDANNPEDQEAPFILDHKTASCYSPGLGGYIAVRFNIFVKEALLKCKFASPVHENAIEIPICFNCKNLKCISLDPMNVISSSTLYHLKTTCSVYSQPLSVVKTRSCIQFKPLGD